MRSTASIIIDGVEYDSAVELADTVVKAEYPDNSAQPVISDVSFTLVNEAARRVIDRVENGSLGLFHGMPSSIRVANNKGDSVETFSGFIDFSDGYKTIEKNECEVTMKPFFGQNAFNDRASGITYVFLEDDGFFSNSDYFTVPWIYEKEFNFIELAILSVTAYIMAREVADGVRRTANNVTDIVATLTGGLTGSVASVVEAIAKAVIEAIFTAVMISALIRIGRELLEHFISPVRYYRAMKLKTLLEKGCEKLGYSFDSSISELENIVYLPSKTSGDDGKSSGVLLRSNLAKKSGVPRPTDRIYTILDAFNFAENLFRAKKVIRGNTVHLEPLINDSFWLRQSAFKIGDVRGVQTTSQLNVEYNTEDLVGRRLYRFETDVNDNFTLDNYSGTTYEVDVELITEQDERLNRITGFQETNFGAALGNRKDRLNVLEQQLRNIASAIDGTIRFFGGRSKLASRVQNRVGMLKVSSRNINIAKALYYTGSQIPANHRDLLSAKALYEKYHTVDSFVENNASNQFIIKRDVKVPFNFDKFIQLMDSGYFLTDEGDLAKVLAWTWSVYNDYATIDFKIRKQYERNLKETTIELS